MYDGGWTLITAHVRRAEDMWKSVLSFYHMDPRDLTQVIRTGSRCPYHWAMSPGPMWLHVSPRLILSFLAYVPFYISICKVQGSNSSTSFITFVIFIFFQVEVKWLFIVGCLLVFIVWVLRWKPGQMFCSSATSPAFAVVLICISLLTGHVQHLFMSQLSISLLTLRC